MKYILKITPEDEIIKVETGGVPKLKELQELVDGYIEVVNIGIRGYVALVNEEGRLRRMPQNIAGTMVGFAECLVGNVLILKECGEKILALDSENKEDNDILALAEHACGLVKRWKKHYEGSDNDI